MIRQALSDYPFVLLSCSVLIAFLAIYGTALYWTFRSRTQAELERGSSLPLEEL